jgi:hypothetical protein
MILLEIRAVVMLGPHWRARTRKWSDKTKLQQVIVKLQTCIQYVFLSFYTGYKYTDLSFKFHTYIGVPAKFFLEFFEPENIISKNTLSFRYGTYLSVRVFLLANILAFIGTSIPKIRLQISRLTLTHETIVLQVNWSLQDAPPNEIIISIVRCSPCLTEKVHRVLDLLILLCDGTCYHLVQRTNHEPGFDITGITALVSLVSTRFRKMDPTLVVVEKKWGSKDISSSPRCKLQAFKTVWLLSSFMH